MRIVAHLRKRPVLALGLLAALLLLAGGALLVWVNIPRHHINQEGFEKIQVGMTWGEVEEILGVPPGDYGQGKRSTGYIIGEFDPDFPIVHDEQNMEEWSAGDVLVRVVYDREGRVGWKVLGTVTREDFFARLRRWLGL